MFDPKNFEPVSKIAQYLMEQKTRGEAAPTSIAFSPANFIDSEDRVKTISSDVKKLRLDLFKKEGPPFFGKSAYSRAVRWLIKTGKDEALQFSKEKGKSQKEFPGLQKKLDVIVDRMNALSPRRYSCNWELPAIPIYKRAKGKKYALQDAIVTFPGMALRALLNAAREFSWRTGFSEHSMISYILIGIEPILPLYSIKAGNKVVLELHRRLNYRDFSSIYGNIMKHFKRQKKETEKNLDIYRFIEERGGQPDHGKMKFWDNAFRAWKRKRPDDKINTSDGLRKAYLRIKRRLK
jgi:hypothetical protein